MTLSICAISISLNMSLSLSVSLRAIDIYPRVVLALNRLEILVGTYPNTHWATSLVFM